jgi:serine/threonine protein kinase/Tol biopolymer transport system component
MIPERWQQIDQLFHSTLEWPPPERAPFLNQECGGDEDLRREVESLLLAHERDGDFLNGPAYEVSTEIFVDCLTELLAGQQIGPYKILSPLGIGGMGEVYLAQDSRLGRKIALKLLSPDFARDRHRVRRFEQEARAASALSHPNVCVIHEIAETKDGRHFIAMEHIDGITLRDRIARRRFGVREALAIADQIAAALSAAHAAGVVHRDIKPENIMVRKDGYVKVLDFGLAKLSEIESPAPGGASSPISNLHTEPGTQMGTVKYMSPEQLREGVVDERTDVWSLGVVLHEMVTGITPFEERSRNEIVASILKRKPARLAFLAGAVPAEFQQIIARALSKQREDRYQTMSALAADLRRLQGQLAAEAPGDSWLLADGVTADEQYTKPVLIKDPHQTSILWSSALTFASHTAEQVFNEIREWPKTTIFAGIAAVLVLLLGLNSQWFVREQPKSLLFQEITMSPLTNGGQSVCAAISPNGSLVAHAERKGGMQELLLSNSVGAVISVVIPAGDFKYRGITFSRDANYLYFTVGETNDVGALYKVPLFGGTPTKVRDGVDSPIAFSPSGDRFAFVRFKRAGAEYFLMVANADGTEERTIDTRRDGNRFSISGPAWSPDERTVVCGAGWWDHGYHMNLVEVDVASGHEKAVSRQQWFTILQAAWLEDKSGLIVSAQEHPVSPSQLWQVSYPQGEAVRITNDVADYGSVSLSRQGNTIVSVAKVFHSQIWVAPDGDAQRARAIATSGLWSYGLTWTSKGRIVFSTMAGKNLNIFRIDPDGANQTQLTFDAGDNYTPATSPDGRLIFFASNRTGAFNIWRMNADDGSDARPLTFSDGNSYPSCSPDGEWVAFDNQSEGAMTIWKVRVEGGNPVPLADKARMPVVSPDNQFIACRHYAEGSSPEIAILPIQGGRPVKSLQIPIMEWQRVQWTSDGRALTYINTVNGVSNLWSYDLNTGAKKQITSFPADQIFAYAWSPDYKQLACERGTAVSNVTIVDSQK